MTERCECCDLPIISCGKAAETRQRAEATERRQDLKSRGFFPAAYAGFCGRCGEWFPEGTLIRADVPGPWMAECCAPESR